MSWKQGIEKATGFPLPPVQPACGDLLVLLCISFVPSWASSNLKTLYGDTCPRGFIVISSEESEASFRKPDQQIKIISKWISSSQNVQQFSHGCSKPESKWCRHITPETVTVNMFL